MVSNVAEFGARALAEVQQHEALKNSPVMQSAAWLEKMQANLDQIRSQIADEDLEAYRLAVAGNPAQ